MAPEWHALGAGEAEVCLDLTLPTGQSFRWRRRADGVWAGAVGRRALALRQTHGEVEFALLNAGELRARGHGEEAPDATREVLRDYFHLNTASLVELYADFEAADPRFAAVAPYFGGTRMLRQDPVECLFSFICSSNNHISRIHGMVNRLCAAYGERMAIDPGAEVLLAPPEPDAPGTPSKAKPEETLELFVFPTVEGLTRATEDELRAAGFGYRAKFITGSAAMLAAKDEGGDNFLWQLREVGSEEAVNALIELPGIGPKVAACVALFSLDKHALIPVDTHVWQIAVEHYTPELADKSLTPKVHAAINEAFETRFGPFAGWAHNILFVSHLREYNKRLPEHLQSPPTPSPNAKAAKRKEHAKALKAKAARAGAAEEEAPEPKKAKKKPSTTTKTAKAQGKAKAGAKKPRAKAAEAGVGAAATEAKASGARAGGDAGVARALHAELNGRPRRSRQ